MRIAVMLPLLFGLVLAILIIRLGVAMVGAVDQWQETRKVAEIAKATEDVFVAVQNARRERASVRSALRAEDSADAKYFRYIEDKRAAFRPAVEKVIALCRHMECAASFDVEALDRSRLRSEELRPEVDQALKMSLSGRPVDLPERFQKAISETIALLEAVSAGLDSNVRMTDSVIAEYIDIKNAAYLMRDALGFGVDEVGDALVRGGITAGGAKNLAGLLGKAEAGRRVLDSLLGSPGLSPAIREAYDAAMPVYTASMDHINAIMEAFAAGKPADVDLLAWNAEADTVLGRLVDVSMVALKEAAVYAEEQSAQALTQLIGAAALAIFALVIGGCGLLLIRHRIVRPIGRISVAMLEVANGRLDTVVPYEDNQDEIGDLSNALKVFKENAVARAKAEALNAENQAQREDRQQSIEALIQAFDASVSSVLQSVASSARELDQAAKSMAEIAETTADESQQSLSAVEQASSNVQTIAAATEEMSASSSVIARQVMESAQVASDAAREAEATNGIVSELAASASRISDIVDLITSIAEQTNLLALNATIEAARAGDAGKGFAVVATEVKNLAMQTAHATDDISAQIKGMQAATGAAVDAITLIRTVIERCNVIAESVSSSVEEQNGAIRQISLNVQVVASSTESVTVGVKNVTGVAVQGGAASDQVLQATNMLTHESDTLRRDIETFLQRIRAA
jgi:methyl-accepting chemotaxis protein